MARRVRAEAKSLRRCAWALWPGRSWGIRNGDMENHGVSQSFPREVTCKWYNWRAYLVGLPWMMNTSSAVRGPVAGRSKNLAFHGRISCLFGCGSIFVTRRFDSLDTQRYSKAKGRMTVCGRRESPRSNDHLFRLLELLTNLHVDTWLLKRAEDWNTPSLPDGQVTCHDRLFFEVSRWHFKSIGLETATHRNRTGSGAWPANSRASEVCQKRGS